MAETFLAENVSADIFGGIFSDAPILQGRGPSRAVLPGWVTHRPRRGGVDPREISPCRRRSAATTPRRRHDGAAAPSQRRDAEKTEKNDVKIMQHGPKMSQNGPKNDPKRFENDSKRAEKRLFYFFGRRNLPKHLPPSSQSVTRASH